MSKYITWANVVIFILNSLITVMVFTAAWSISLGALILLDWMIPAFALAHFVLTSIAAQILLCLCTAILYIWLIKLLRESLLEKVEDLISKYFGKAK